LISLAIALAAYLFSYVLVLVTGWTPTENFWFPPLFFAMLVVIVVGFLLQALAFWLDLYHIPVSLAVVGMSALLFFVNRTDHFFDLKSTPKPPAASTAPTLEQVARSWKLPPSSFVDGRGGCRTLVVVTAAGGGIQASAWSARVLVGLHEQYGDVFSGSVGLISAVSGGSVGALYYFDQWGSRARPFEGPALAVHPGGRPKKGSIRWNAEQSSLEATGWGLAFPDLLRTFCPPLAFRTDDRGTRVEEAWRARMTHPGAQFAAWGQRMAAGEMPVVVFNATVVETGQRLTASPVLKRRPNDPPPDSTQARELLELYPMANPLVSTPVRLSATFPYVSPICRPLEGAADDPRNDYHFCDGGFVDNEGMATAIDWLRALLDPGYLDASLRRNVFDQILFIRISPFPIYAQAAPAKANKGWLYATVGPLDALQHVRVASQAERNSIATGLFIEAARAQGIPVRSALFDFRPKPDSGPTPLSWMLTEEQKCGIDEAWETLLKRPAPADKNDPFGTVDQVFPRAPSP
jgi:hypothetical protein